MKKSFNLNYCVLICLTYALIPVKIIGDLSSFAGFVLLISTLFKIKIFSLGLCFGLIFMPAVIMFLLKKSIIGLTKKLALNIGPNVLDVM